VVTVGLIISALFSFTPLAYWQELYNTAATYKRFSLLALFGFMHTKLNEQHGAESFLSNVIKYLLDAIEFRGHLRLLAETLLCGIQIEET
jgi:hypothetical protein